MTSWKVGMAKVDITPRLGVPLMGNFRDDYAARGVHDPLYAHAMVLENNTGRRVALLSIDACELDRNNIAWVKKCVLQQTKLPEESILVAAIHTHSGPATSNLGSLPKADDADIQTFLTKAAKAVSLAIADLKPATLAIGYSQEDRLSFNRRLACKDGKTHMNWESLDPAFVVKPLGPIDPQVIALSVDRDNQRQGVLVNFGLHPAILAGDNWLYSADYPGYLAEALAKVMGDDFMTVFFNGCCGNVNHIDYSDPLQGRGFKMAECCGYVLAAAVQQAMRTPVEIHGDVLEISHEKVSLKRLKISEKDRQWSEDVLEKAKNNPTQGQVDGLPDEFYAKTWLKMYEVQNKDDEVDVMVIRLGDLAIVGLPGEIFCELGMEIKKSSPAKHTMVIELANDSIGYMPNRIAFEQGGYEPSVGSTLYEPGAGEQLIASAMTQLKTLFKK
jgi:hypothetical protein